MATIKLSETECRRDLLPRVCMFCGEEATTSKQRNFSWHPQWIWILVLFGLLGIIIAAVIASAMTKRMTVRVPVCDLHEGFWKRKGMWIGFTFLGLVVAIIGAIAIGSSQPPGQDDLTGPLVLISFVLVFAWLILVAVYTTRGVRPAEVADRYIRLTGVNKLFVDALEDDRDRDREAEREYEEKRRARRERADQESPRPRYDRLDDDLERRARD